MPNFDGTGPQGQGAMTGRRRGRCRVIEKNQIEKNENQNVVYGLGRGGIPRGGGGFGNGRGARRGFGNR